MGSLNQQQRDPYSWQSINQSHHFEKRQKWHYIERVYNKEKDDFEEIDHFDKENKILNPFQINIAIGSILNPGDWQIPFTFPLN